MSLGPLLLAVLVALTLPAQDLPAQLARACGLPLPQLQALQTSLTAAALPAGARAYQQAFLDYCLVNRLKDRDPARAKALLERTLEALEPARDAESLALRGGCLGLKLDFHPLMGPWLAPKALGLFREAERLNPGNPRVLIFKGVHLLFTPALFGGGPSVALPILAEAARAAAAETPAEGWAPRWGKVESLGWLALCQAKLGHRAEAEATLARAQALDPEQGFTRWIQDQGAFAAGK